jgi:hypothetical protein
MPVEFGLHIDPVPLPGPYQVAAIVYLGRIPLGTVAVELFLPFHHVGAASVFLD